LVEVLIELGQCGCKWSLVTILHVGLVV